jgi:hypothetical protein
VCRCETDNCNAPAGKQTLELVVTYKDVDDKKYEAKNTIEVHGPSSPSLNHAG